MDYFDQVGLVGHDLGDRLVGVGMLINQLLGHGVVPGPARHRASQRLGRQLAEGRLATETPTGTMGAGLVRGFIALTTHDERGRAHRTRDDPHVRESGPYGALAGDPDLLAQMSLLGRVVV